MSGAIPSEFQLDEDGLGWVQPLRDAVADPCLGRLGGFELLAQVSRGGQGIVFRARDANTKQPVALKRLLAGALAGPGARRRLERELEAAGALDHAAIVRVLGIEERRGEPVLAMEWIDGVPVNRWARPAPGAGAVQPLAERMRVFREICAAVRHAHQRGVIHRDLKPSNVLVDAAGHPHLLDFGLAKCLDAAPHGSEALTRSHDFVGTLAYAAPEQLRGAGHVDVRSDVYALGVLGYEMLTGVLPVRAHGGVVAWLEAIERAAPPPPSRIEPAVDRDLDAIVLQALAADPERRYQTVDALVEDLRRCHDGLPISIRPPGALRHLRAIVRQHRWPCALAATVLLAASAGAALLIHHARRLTVERDRAYLAELRADDLRRAAEAASATATLRTAQSEALLAFLLEDVLGAADHTSTGQALTLAEALLRATTRVQQRMQQHPQVRLLMLETIAGIQENLGHAYAAADVLRLALRICADELPHDHARAAMLQARLGGCLVVTGAHAEAEDALRQAHATQRGQAPSSLPLARTLVRLAALHVEVDRLDEAEALYREGLDMLRAHLRDDHPEHLLWSARHAILLGNRGRHAEAEQRLAEILVQRRAQLGDVHAEIAHVLHALGKTRVHLGRIGEGEADLRAAIDIHEKVADPRGAVYALMHGDLAEALAARAAYDEALPVYERAIALHRAQTPPHAPALAMALLAQAELLQMTMQAAAAESAAREAADALRAWYGGPSAQLADALGVLAGALYHQRRFSDAAAVLAEAWEVAVARTGEQSLAALDVLHSQAMVHLALGDVAAAEPRFQRCLELSRALGRSELPYTARILANYSDLLFGAGRIAEAEARMREGLAIAGSFEEVVHRALMSARLGRILALSGRATAAVQEVEAAVEILRAHLPEAHGWVSLALECLCICLIQQQRDDDAERVIEHSRALIRAQQGEGHPALQERARVLDAARAARGS